MNNNLLVSAAVSILPWLTIGFVGLLVLQKLYVKIRSRYNATVNCWFCNQNARVPYVETNSWTCPHCEQYNGFNKDGDYNREIFQQLDCSSSSEGRWGAGELDDSGEIFGRTPPRNGFCNMCNEAQRMKVEKLAQFEPKSESHFDKELKVYKAKLEEQYRLCFSCDRHLNKVLREKKKMVLGSKFLDFIIKGADRMKQPHLNQLQHAQQQLWKRRLARLIVLLAALNLCYLCNSVLPALTRDNLTRPFGETLGHPLFIALSHVVAVVRVFFTYCESLAQHEMLQKVALFVRTLSLMLLYSLGLKLPQLERVSFASIYLLSCPFAVLGAAFAYNVIDNFRLTRCTALLVLWSALAGGLIGDQFVISQNMLMFLASLVTIAVLLLRQPDNSAKLHDSTATSFHKMYSEDYLSDEDTISLLSEQLNSSAASMRSKNTSRSRYSNTSPLASSAFSLHNGIGGQPGRSRFLPNHRFTPFGHNDNNLRPNYAASMCNFPTARLHHNNNHKASSNTAASVFGSNLDLSGRDRLRSASTIFGNAAAMPYDGNTSFTDSRSQYLRHMEPTSHNSAEGIVFGKGPNMAMDIGYPNAAATPLHSPFSLSSNAVYHQQLQEGQRIHSPASSLLSPSRFSTSALNSRSGNGPSWLSSGLFNTQQQQQKRFLLESHRNGMSAIDENLSRASSQSSGFESQNGQPNGGGLGNSATGGRENSCGPADTLPSDNLNGPSAFQPIEPRLNGLPNASSPFYGFNAPPVRKALHPISGRDSFNLRRINEELPSIRRGDLLRKWKESQAGHSLG